MFSIARPVFLLFATVIVVLTFQNCHSGNGLGSAPRGSALQESGGNGGGYEGKPDGFYYRYTPHFTCEGQPSAEQIAEFRNGQAYLYENQKNQCDGGSAPLPTSSILVSPFQTEFVGVNDVLFKRYESKPQGIPNVLAEILCRDNFDNPSLEIVAHYDREQNAALARIYYAGSKVSDFPVSRVLSANEVQYVSDDLTFKVDLSEPARPQRKFAGLIQSNRDPLLANKTLLCITGGSLDTSGWSLKALTTGNAGPFHLLDSGDIMFYSEVSRWHWSSSFYRSTWNLMKIDLAGAVSEFSKNLLGGDHAVESRIRQSAPRHYLFAAKPKGEMWSSVYLYNWETMGLKRLTNLTPCGACEEGGFKTAQLTAGGYFVYDTVIYGTLSTGFLTPNTTIIRVYDLNRDTFQTIYSSTTAVQSVVLEKADKVLLLFKDADGSKIQLSVYNLRTNLFSQIPLTLAENCGLSFLEAYIAPDENAIFAYQSCNKTSVGIVRLSVLDGSLELVAPGMWIQWVSSNKKWLIATDSLGNNIAYNLETGQRLNIPINPRLGFNPGNTSMADRTNFMFSDENIKVAYINDQYLLGFGGSPESPSMYQINLNSGQSETICDNAEGRKLYLGHLDGKNTYLFTYDSNLKVYRFYHAKSPTECPRLNEFPSAYSYALKLIPTRIGFGLILGNPLSRYTTVNSHEAVFVPVGGQPPMKLGHAGGGNWEMEVSADRNRIVLRGPDASGVIRIFSFDLN